MILFIIGLISGIISGMGIGGGTILIPSLILFANLNQHEAQGINLIAFIPIACVALITHLINKNIKFKIIFPIILFGLIGAICGSLIATNISANILRKMFGIFLLIMGIYTILSKENNHK